MILNLIQDYISRKVTNANSHLNTAIVLKQINTETDMDMIGASESYINYQLYINSIESLDYEFEGMDKVNVRMDFIFLVANKNYTIYKKLFDRYLYKIRRILKVSEDSLLPYMNEDISVSLSLNDIGNVNVTNADRFEDEYYKPSIEFTLQTIDSGLFKDVILKSESL